MAVVKNQSFIGKQYWKIAPGKKAWQWAECRDNGYIAIGWEEMKDVSGLSHEEFEQRRLKVRAELSSCILVRRLHSRYPSPK